MITGLIVLVLLLLATIVVATASIKIIGQAEVMVIERLGRFHRARRARGSTSSSRSSSGRKTIDVRYFEADITGVQEDHRAARRRASTCASRC